MSVKQELNQVLEALGYLGEIDTETYKSRIQDLINIGNTTYGQKVSGQLVGGQPVETLQAANDLKIQTIAVGVSVDGNHGFSNYVNKVSNFPCAAQGCFCPASIAVSLIHNLHTPSLSYTHQDLISSMAELTH